MQGGLWVIRTFYMFLVTGLLQGTLMEVRSHSEFNKEWWANAYDRPDAVFVQLGHDAKLQCIPVTRKSEAVPQKPTYTWQDMEDEPITDGRDVIQKNGTLKVEYAESKDGGKYTCTIKAKDITQVYEHHLIVYRMPTISYETTLAYKTSKKCDEAIIDSKSKQIVHTLCLESVNDCVFTATGKCGQQPGNTDISNDMLRLYIRQISSLPEKNFPKCDVNCVKDAIRKKLDKNYKKIKQFIAKEKVMTDEGSQLMKEYVQKSQLSECSAGYRMYKHIFCLPCHPGHYSETNKLLCSPCELNYYQPDWGMAHCHKCPLDTTTKAKGSHLITLCEGANAMHLDGAGVHVLVESKTVKMYGVIAGLSVGFALLCTAAAVAVWHFKFRKINEPPDEYLSKMALLDDDNDEQPTSQMTFVGVDNEEFPLCDRPPFPLPRPDHSILNKTNSVQSYDSQLYMRPLPEFPGRHAQDEDLYCTADSSYSFPSPPPRLTSSNAIYSNIPDYISIQGSLR